MSEMREFSEIMISHPEMLRTFQRFFMEELVGEQILPERTGAEILEELIEECRRMCEPE